ncbi:cysteine--tRNA ligase, partial [Klebsiella oxytoca]
DLNTSLGVTAIFDVLKAQTSDATKLALIGDFDQVLSLSLLEKAAALRAKAAQARTAHTGGGDDVITGEGDAEVG